MKKPPTVAQLKRAITKWRKLLGLQNDTINVYFQARHPEDPACYASCAPMWQYNSSDVYFDPSHPSWLRPEVDLDETVAHELIHHMIAPVTQTGYGWATGDPKAQKLLEDLEEVVVTRLSNMPVIADHFEEEE